MNIRSILLFLTLLGIVALAAGADEQPLEKRLADLPLPEGWKCTGDVDTYDKDTLFKLINGEAELYFPYGFERVFVVAYAKVEDTIEAQVYKMGSPLDAFGVYSTYRYPDDEFVEVGADGFIGSTQLVFYQDRYFAKLRISGKSDENRDSLLAVAKAVSGALPQPPSAPAELALLDVEEKAPKTEKYVAESLLGYRFFPRGLVAEVELGEQRVRVFHVFPAKPKPEPESEPEHKAKKTTIEEYLAYLDEFGGEYRWVETPSGKILVAQDPLHKGIVLQQAGDRVIGVAGLPAPAQGFPLLKQLARLKKRQTRDATQKPTLEN